MVSAAFEKKIGIYSGSFNPIHIGHLALANWLCEYTSLDEIWFLVTPQNPFKSQGDLLDDNLRLLMVEQAIAGYPKFKASDFEFHLPKPSYTIDTLHALTQVYPHFQFYLIIGSDNWLRFSSWKNSQAIISEYSLIIYPRKGYLIDMTSVQLPQITVADAPEMEISSTFIRRALAEKRDIRFFLPKEIWPLLKENKGLFKN